MIDQRDENPCKEGNAFARRHVSERSEFKSLSVSVRLSQMLKTYCCQEISLTMKMFQSQVPFYDTEVCHSS